MSYEEFGIAMDSERRKPFDTTAYEVERKKAQRTGLWGCFLFIVGSVLGLLIPFLGLKELPMYASIAYIAFIVICALMGNIMINKADAILLGKRKK